MGLCAQAADERGRAGWNAEGGIKREERKGEERMNERKERKKVGREDPEGKTTV